MTLAAHNLLMRFASPAVQAIILGLAIAFMSLSSHAQSGPGIPAGPNYQMFSLDDPQCGVCKAWERTARDSWDELPAEVWIPYASITYSLGYRKNKEGWPEWFRKAMEDGRIQPVEGTPTFIFVNLEDHREVGRIVGYSGSPVNFYERVVPILEAIHQYKP